MLYLLNTIDAVLQPIDGLHRVSLMAVPYLKAAWQLLTAEKTRRIVRAVGVAIWVLGTICLAGMVEVVRVAVREATIAVHTQLNPEVVVSCQLESIGVTESVLPVMAPETISPQIGVRQLRKLATQRGIRNAARMRKPELLALLAVAGGASALGR
jgi:hypothetical protein